MASTIKVNNIQNQCGANIINESANTITIGASGDTISLAAGASQTGFGRTGTVDWDTTAKTASFTAVSGTGYFVDTSGGAVTMTLPATPSAGDIVSVKDYALSFGTNNLTLDRNGSPINGQSVLNPSIGSVGASITLIYVDGTQGWVPTVDDTSSLKGGTDYIAATGGTITICGNDKIHTFTGPGTFSIQQIGPLSPGKVEYRVVGGGGGGGENGGGGGGAGGHRTNYPTACGIPVCASPGSYPITVGAGGAGAPPTASIPTSPVKGTNGNNSIFSSITSAGGGGGGNGHTGSQASPKDGANGGSGGGGGSSQPSPTPGAGGTGNTPPVSPPQGNPGGVGQHTSGTSVHGAGGGGASQPGGNAGTSDTGGGGNGVANSITGSPVTLGGGGSGGPFPPSAGPKAGGSGGGGAGGGVNGTANTGGGAGGGTYVGGAGGTGGSGIVIIRYRFQ